MCDTSVIFEERPKEKIFQKAKNRTIWSPCRKHTSVLFLNNFYFAEKYLLAPWTSSIKVIISFLEKLEKRFPRKESTKKRESFDCFLFLQSFVQQFKNFFAATEASL
jgi:hypothetical protein